MILTTLEMMTAVPTPFAALSALPCPRFRLKKAARPSPKSAAMAIAIVEIGAMMFVAPLPRNLLPAR